MPRHPLGAVAAASIGALCLIPAVSTSPAAATATAASASATRAAPLSGTPVTPVTPVTPERSALTRTLDAAPTPLRTPFEASNGATWTTLPQWRSFWRSLDASSGRVTTTRIGTSAGGHPLSLYAVGHPAPKEARTAAAGSTLLLNCSIHGDEPSGREGCLTLARDMATTQDPRWKRFLSTTTVLFVNPNPDGWVANTRTNSKKVDLNRDFLALTQPETKALARVIRDYRPDVLNDLHEYGTRQDYAWSALTLWPRNRNTDPTVHALSKRMVREYTAPRIVSEGMTNSDYGRLVKDGEPYLQIAGDGQGRILRNYAGLRHVVGQLTEAASDPVTDAERADAALTNRRRVAVQYQSVTGSVEFLVERRARIVQATTDAATRATKLGAEQKGVVYFAGQDDIIPTEPEEVERNPMCGYQLDAAQARQHRNTLALHGIASTRRAGGAFVSLAQPGRGLIPLLLDARSEFALTKATPVAQCTG